MTDYQLINNYKTADIVETATGFVVLENLPKDAAKTWVRKLNFGAGFGGWTPEFFLHRLVVL
jgi:hypothetical protein